MKSAFYASNDSLLDIDPMLDLIAQEDEYHAVADIHNNYLCTVEYD